MSAANDRPMWEPSSARIARSAMTRFMLHAGERYGIRCGDYASLYDWSIRAPEQFWPAVWDYCGVLAQRGWDTVLEHGDRMPGARWFTGAELNFAANLLRYRDERPALVYYREDGLRLALTYAELAARVGSTAAALRSLGLGPGDRVAGFMPNHPETVIAMLATVSCGGIWSSCSPDFGSKGVIDRFGQIEPRVLFTADGYHYNGKRLDSLGRAREVAAGLPSLERVVVVPHVSERPDLAGLPQSVLMEDFRRERAECEFTPLPFDHPLYIMYSSGTTGRPKCIVHGAGGTLLQHLKELVLHTDLGREDRIFYFTTCGWMMWNWLVSSLAAGATVVLYDGSPFHPGPEALWRMAEQERVTIFGTSAKYLAAVEKAGFRPRRHCDLTALRTVLSTGSPLLPASFDFTYEHIKPDLQLASISGGTDIISCFALGNPILPVWRGELQCRGLGMAVEIWDDAGRPLRGEKGELVCTRPFPSMPIGFWSDPAGERYRSAYFERFPGVWCHGDFAELTTHDGLIIFGRSDALLNPGGVRIGTAEIYRQVERLPAIEESIAVGQEWDGDVRIVLFVRMREGAGLDEALKQQIRSVIRENTTPRHVPAKIIAVPDIPRTISGKITELAVRDVIHGRPVKNTDALANPEALDHFRGLPELLEP